MYVHPPLGTYKKSDNLFFYSFAEYECLTGYLSMASSVPQPIRIGTYVFDCRYNYKNRPIFRQVGGSQYFSFHGTNSWMVGPDPSRFFGGIELWFPNANYVLFDSLSVSTYYWSNSQWNYVTKNAMNITTANNLLTAPWCSL